MSPADDVDPATLSSGPILLLAGPGTGKTHTLARRVKWLVEDQNVAPDSITLITFTDEAARNMRERLSDPAKRDVFLPTSRQPGRICTMHSLAFGVVLANYGVLGFAGPPGLLPSHLVDILLGDAAELLGLPRHVGGEQSKVCRQKGRCHPSDERDECRVCGRYSAILRNHNVVDYNDQMLLACRVLADDEQVLAPYRASCVHLLVDEYQDINEAQFRLIKLLAGEDGTGLYAVGDDNQSIYSFRGGTPDYIREFARDWPGPTVHQLTESYRCPQPVIDAAASVIRKGCRTFLNDPQIHSKTGVDAPVTVNQVTSAAQEALHIAQTIARARGSRDALILIPRSTYAGPIKQALRQLGVPYDCRTEVERSGMNVVNECARWLGNQKDNFALRFLLDRVVQHMAVAHVPGVETDEALDEWRQKGTREIACLWKKVEAGQSLYAALRRHRSPSVLALVQTKVDQLRAVKAAAPDVILAEAARTLMPWDDGKQLLSEIGEWVEDSRSRNRTRGRPAARVLTMASAKGLEADLVFVVGLEQNSFPYYSAEGEELEEQYRLLYVSMTRAKEELHLYHALVRRGSISFRKRPPGSEHGKPTPAEVLTWLPPGTTEWREHWPRRATKRQRRKVL